MYGVRVALSALSVGRGYVTGYVDSSEQRPAQHRSGFLIVPYSMGSIV